MFDPINRDNCCATCPEKNGGSGDECSGRPTPCSTCRMMVSHKRGSIKKRDKYGERQRANKDGASYIGRDRVGCTYKPPLLSCRFPTVPHKHRASCHAARVEQTLQLAPLRLLLLLLLLPPPPPPLLLLHRWQPLDWVVMKQEVGKRCQSFKRME